MTACSETEMMELRSSLRNRDSCSWKLDRWCCYCPSASRGVSVCDTVCSKWRRQIQRRQLVFEHASSTVAISILAAFAIARWEGHGEAVETGERGGTQCSGARQRDAASSERRLPSWKSLGEPLLAATTLAMSAAVVAAQGLIMLPQSCRQHIFKGCRVTGVTALSFCLISGSSTCAFAEWQTCGNSTLSIVDPSIDGAAMNIRALFQSLADEDGIVGKEALSELLNCYQYDDHVGPLHDAYVIEVMNIWGENQSLDEKRFLRGYSAYHMHGDYLLREWKDTVRVQCWDGATSEEHYRDSVKICCGTEERPAKYSACFGSELVFSVCCSQEGLAKTPQPTSAEVRTHLLSVLPPSPSLTLARQTTVETPVPATAWAQVERRCKTTMKTTCSLGTRSGPVSKRLAVLIVGVRERFYPLPTLRHVVLPAFEAGYHVDYFCLLSWRPAHGQRSVFSQSALRGRSNPAFANVTKEALQDYVIRHARHHGARNVHFLLLEPDLTLDPLGPTWSRIFGRRMRSSLAFENSVLRFKKVEMLWNMTLDLIDGNANEEPYSHVLLTRDDVYWVDDVHLSLFSDPQAIYSATHDGPCKPEPGTAYRANDRAILMGGVAAMRFLNWYSDFYKTQSRQLDKATSVEEFLQLLAALKGLRWNFVPTSWLPSLLALHTVTRELSNDTSGNEVKQTNRIEPLHFCIRGLGGNALGSPDNGCIHPALIRHPICP
eukprot:TRINITY_DN19775_c0_g1_i2.p1 TRINITY_DN19775_c0_g1~~TRINITY_DN19775_c0_g1_i2.p1  ORF type:complete len:718 (-),score=91.79 TRINITY_DN19775_c0_g1_i2:37-2190(-)